MADWFKTAVIYQVLIDRFASTEPMTPDCGRNEFLGGTINGIRSKLLYIRSLGVTCLWLSPINETEQYHGYHITNFDVVEPRFGTLDDLKRLIEECHHLDMRIIVDWVPNHCSVNHPFFQQAQKQEASTYRGWFYFAKWPSKYLNFLHYPELVKLNLNNPAARDYMLNNAIFWLSLGIDGFRIDHAVGPSMSFWKTLRRKVKKRFPEAVLIGEVWASDLLQSDFKTVGILDKRRRRRWGVNQQELQQDYSEVFDGVLDFHSAHLVREHFRKYGKVTRLLRTDCAAHYEVGYSQDFCPVIFLDNHDLDRFLFVCKGNPTQLIAALKFILQNPWPVVIYYGTEALMGQTSTIHSDKPFADLQARQPMAWDTLSEDIVALIKRLAEKRVIGEKE